MSYIWLIVGFILIIKSSDILVDSASSIATRAKLPKILIALTVVAFGTCAPELAISFQSIAVGNGSVALANVIGSCIINIALVIGVASFINPIRMKNETINKELPLLLFITVVFTVLVLNRIYNNSISNFINRVDGILLLVMFTLFVSYLIRLIKNSKNVEVDFNPKYGMIKSIIYAAISLIIIAISGNLVVNNAVIIAESLGISQKVITMFIIVIGTSLPELVLTIQAARKKEFEMAIGNVVGTNIFNICIVLGLPIAIFGKVSIVDFNIIDISVVLLSSIMLLLFAKSDKKISKLEGIIMISTFVLYYFYVMLF